MVVMRTTIRLSKVFKRLRLDECFVKVKAKLRHAGVHNIHHGHGLVREMAIQKRAVLWGDGGVKGKDRSRPWRCRFP